MAEEKQGGILHRHGHKLTLGGEALALLSLLFLAPLLRRRHEHRNQRRHRRLAIHWH